MIKQFLIALFFVPVLVSAQSFEGTVSMTQTNADGSTVQIKWFIRPDKIALETTQTYEEGTFVFKAIPDLATGTLFFKTKGNDGEFVYNLNKSMIVASKTEPLISATPGSKSEHPTYGHTQMLDIRTATTQTLANIATDIDVNFGLYADYFKSDYAVLGLFMSQMKGLPVEYTITDPETHQEISRVTTQSIERRKLSDDEFK